MLLADPRALILGEMSKPRSRQTVVKKMLELVLITDKAEVRRKRKPGATVRRRRKKPQPGASSGDDSDTGRGEHNVLPTAIRVAYLTIIFMLASSDLSLYCMSKSSSAVSGNIDPFQRTGRRHRARAANQSRRCCPVMTSASRAMTTARTRSMSRTFASS